MRADTLIRTEGMETLIKNMGLIEAERFVMLIQKEPFDYTKWQENLYKDLSIDEVYNNAAEFRRKNKELN